RRSSTVRPRRSSTPRPTAARSSTPPKAPESGARVRILRSAPRRLPMRRTVDAFPLAGCGGVLSRRAALPTPGGHRRCCRTDARSPSGVAGHVDALERLELGLQRRDGRLPGRQLLLEVLHGALVRGPLIL